MDILLLVVVLLLLWLLLFLHQTVDMVLCTVLGGRHLEHERHAQERLVRVFVGYNLQTKTKPQNTGSNSIPTTLPLLLAASSRIYAPAGW